MKRKFLKLILPFLALGMAGDDKNVYQKLNQSKVRFSRYYRYHDPDRDRRMSLFCVHGESVMAYSRKDAIKRWVHADLKNRKKRTRR